MKLFNWIKNLFYRAPEGFEDAYKSAVKRVKQSQQTPETDPLIESCGKTIVDIIVSGGWVSKGTVTKIYFNDGTVLVIDSVIGSRWDKSIIDTSIKLNKYTVGKGQYTKSAYIEVEA